MKDIGKNLPKNVNFSSFADDFRISISNSSVDTIIASLKSALITIQDRLIQKSLQLSWDKTKLMLFSHASKQIKPFKYRLSIGQESLQNEKQVKYVGAIWDHRLNWEAHVIAIKAKASKLLNILFSIANFK